jgi:AhpD family alkylhydroperoxidase
MAKTTQDHGQTRREIQEMFGFVPKFFEALPEKTFDHEWAVQRDFELGESVLPAKTKELIGLAIAAHIKCRYCIYFHTEAAKMHGATEQELREACFMGGFTVQMSNSLTGAQVDYESFRQEVDRAMQHVRSRHAAE